MVQVEDINGPINPFHVHEAESNSSSSAPSANASWHNYSSSSIAPSSTLKGNSLAPCNDGEINPRLSLLELMAIILSKVSDVECRSRCEGRTYRMILVTKINKANQSAATLTAEKASSTSRLAFLWLAFALATIPMPSETVKQLLHTVANSIGPQLSSSYSSGKEVSIQLLQHDAQDNSRNEYDLASDKQKESFESKVEALFQAIMQSRQSLLSRGG